MSEINFNPIDKTFINYFPNYFKKETNQQKSSEIKDKFLINDLSSIYQESTESKKIEKTTTKENTLSSLPVNLFMEDTENSLIKATKPLIGPTNLHSKIDDMFINPRYL